ncbi:EamA family transporter [Rhodobacteraceae bacterium]|nr:EamA family transporter [Paracoccaceae bacterium]
MTTIVFIAVLLAALLHAIWNSLVKGGRDKYLNMSAVAFGYVPISAVSLLIVPFPAIESWPYIVSSMFLHAGYMAFLLRSYHHGDLTQTYPIARGSAPLMVAVVSVFVLGVSLSSFEMLSLLFIGAGIMSLSLVRRESGLRNTHAVQLALITGAFIAAYSINDGLGVRLSGSPVGYFAATALGVAAIWGIGTACVRPDAFRAVATKARGTFLIGGNASFIAYVLVVWAFTQAPIALVSALRETSIIFALLIGVGFLKEKLDLAKVASTFMTLIGVVLLRLAK